MTNREAPRDIPTRTSTFDRLAHMPSAQEMLRSEHETALFHYLPVVDEDGFPIVEQDLPFTAADSGEIRQAALPVEEAMPGNDARWMSADEVAAYIQQAEREAEQEALAELQYGAVTDKSGEKRQLRVRYDGPEASIKLQVSEGVDGDKIDRILHAFTGMTGQPAPVSAPRIAPAPQPYYLESAPMSAPTPVPAITAYPDTFQPQTADAEVYYVEAEERPLTLGTMFEGAPQPERRAPGFMYRHRKGITAMVFAATAPFWYDSAIDVVYETSRQGINGEIISGKDAIAALRGQEINKEDK